MQYMISSDDYRERTQYRKVRIRWMCPGFYMGQLKEVLIREHLNRKKRRERCDSGVEQSRPMEQHVKGPWCLKKKQANNFMAGS